MSKPPEGGAVTLLFAREDQVFSLSLCFIPSTRTLGLLSPWFPLWEKGVDLTEVLQAGRMCPMRVQEGHLESACCLLLCLLFSLPITFCAFYDIHSIFEQ